MTPNLLGRIKSVCTSIVFEIYIVYLWNMLARENDEKGKTFITIHVMKLYRYLHVNHKQKNQINSKLECGWRTKYPHNPFNS